MVLVIVLVITIEGKALQIYLITIMFLPVVQYHLAI